MHISALKKLTDESNGTSQARTSGEGGGATDAQVQSSQDAFMTDSIQLIGTIYKFAKMRRIPASEFEKIISRSYEKAWKLSERSHAKGKNSAEMQDSLTELMQVLQTLDASN